MFMGTCQKRVRKQSSTGLIKATSSNNTDCDISAFPRDEIPLCSPGSRSDVPVSAVWAHTFTPSGLPDDGCDGATGPLASGSAIIRETGRQLAALGPTPAFERGELGTPLLP
ncbi:hypothetical protein EYF80_054498 [Liparis tanakae]|uniref:Uncharacterized protein n=1 Tax=Liparis tanakae TaxID=230148 RepID=A0A4Z2F385_9TELE|nr:hypothetical protein EYF80_054498 [Liparis tanakae]